jgi:hypothetical protein
MQLASAHMLPGMGKSVKSASGVADIHAQMVGPGPPRILATGLDHRCFIGRNDR